MLNKIIWFLIVLVIAWVWFSTVLNSCSNEDTMANISSLGQDKSDRGEAIFELDEDSGDDEYMVKDESDEPDEDEIIKDREEKNEIPISVPKDKPAELIKNEVKETKKKSTKKETKEKKLEEPEIRDELVKGDYLVVAGTFSSEINAVNFVAKLRKMGYRSADKIVFDFSQYFSVIEGRYKSESQARAKGLELKKKGINAYVHTMRSKLYDEN